MKDLLTFSNIKYEISVFIFASSKIATLNVERFQLIEFSSLKPPFSDH